MIQASRQGYLYGYYLERGIHPEELDRLGREEKLAYLAFAELNTEQRKETMKQAFLEALEEFFK